mgnify:CR=1 FL=1
MIVNRETVYNALFDRLKTIEGLRTSSRTLKHWTDVPAAQQPALFVSHKSESTDPRPNGAPPKKTLMLDVYVYVKTQNQTPSTALNRLLQAVDEALKPDTPPQMGLCTLGGLVAHCWIEGTTETDEGVLGDQAVAIIPIHILCH